METFEIQLDVTRAWPVFHVKGYYSEEAGTQVNDQATELFRGGKIRLAIDFTECYAINSPGIAALMELALIASDDFKGKIILAGLNPLNTNVLKVAGVIPFIASAPTIPEALEILESR